MPVSDRGYIRGSHPAGCTCVACERRRKRGGAYPVHTSHPLGGFRPKSPEVTHRPGVQWKKVLAFFLPLAISAAISLAYAVAGMDSGGRSFAEGTCAEKLQSANKFIPKWKRLLHDLETQAETVAQDAAAGVPKAIEESKQIAVRIEEVKAEIKKYEDLIAPCLANADGQ